MPIRLRTKCSLQVFLKLCKRNTVDVEEPRHDSSVLCLEVMDMCTLRSNLCDQDSRVNHDEGGVESV